jgi:hypothetical protein
MSASVAELVERFGAGFVPEVAPPYDLRVLCRRLGRVPGPLIELPPRVQVRMLEPAGCQRVDAEPARVFGVIDGIQPPARVAYWRAGRPVGLVYVAAGCIEPTSGEPRAHEERLLIIVSHLDEGWARDLASGVPIAVVRERYPAELVSANSELHRRLRHRLERDVLAAVRAAGRLVVVDGHLRDVAPGAGAVAGIVKSHAFQYLGDEREVAQLDEGELSSLFQLPAVHDGEIDRFSAYLRLHRAEESEWSHGLVRLETTDAGLLEPVASWALTNRQGPSADPRWPVHLAATAYCETWLRSRIPPILG